MAEVEEARDVEAITIRFPSALMQRLRDLAQREDRSLNAQIVRFVREKLDEQEQ